MTARKLFSAALAVFIVACSDGGSTGPGADPGFTADQTAYQPFAVATVQLNGQAPPAGTVVSGMLGTATVSLVSSSDSSLTFMVPDVPGAQTLKFDIGGSSYSGLVTVTAAQNVANPTAFLESVGDVADEAVNAVTAAVNTQPLTGDSAVAIEMLQEARDSLASFRRMLAQMTPEEAQQVANILNANLSAEHRALVMGVQAGTTSAAAYAIPAVCKAKSTALEQYQCTWGSFFTSLKDVAKYLGAAALAAETMPATGLVGFAVAAVSTSFALLEGVNTFWLGTELLRIHGMLAWEIGAATVNATLGLFRTEVVSNDLLAEATIGALASPTTLARFNALSATSSMNMTRVMHDRPVTFKFSPKLRPAQLSDRALPLSWVNGALRLVAQYNSMVKPKYQLKFAAPAGTFPMTVPYNQIDVEVVTNSNVKVKSVTGAGDRTQVVFTSTAPGIQKFTYDIVYTSGVYPEVRVRHEAELHPQTFTLTDLSGREFPDTLRLVAPWQYRGLLVNPDGSRIDPNLTVQLGTETTYQGGAFVGMTYSYNSEFYMNVYVQPGRQLVVDTFTVKVMKDGAPLRNLTVIVADSMGMYARTVPGTWVHTFTGYEHRDVLVFNANGTGQVTSRTNTRTGEAVTGYDPNFTWRVQMPTTSGTEPPVFMLYWSFGTYAYTINLRYGQTSYLQTGVGGTQTLVKQ